MARLFAFALAVAAALASARAEIPEEDGVLVLSADNFDEAIAKYNPLLVEFYAPWCGHCKKLEPEYIKAAEALAPAKVLAKVDATVENELAQRFQIKGFPTLTFFRGDASSPAEYNGGREASSIVSWVKKKSGPATTAIESASAAEKFAAAADVAVIGFFKENSEAAKVFNDVAAGNDDIPFGVTSSDAVRAAYKVAAGEEAIVVVNKFEGEENVVVYQGSLKKAKDIASFVDSKSLPVVVKFTPENAPKIFRGAIKTHFLLFADDTAEGYEALKADFRAVASAYTGGKMLFVTVDPTQDRVVSYFGLGKGDMPTGIIVHMPEGESMKKYVMPKEDSGDALSQEKLAAFLEKYEAGTVKPFLKSEEVPKADASAPVTVVVGKNFNEVVLDPKKNVLLEFYAPWCGHCKSLEPKYKALGEALAAYRDEIVIAKMDATANEVDYPGVNVRGFPTILYFPAGEEKTVVEYEGGRDVPDFVAFLEKQTGKKLDVTLPAKTAEEGDLEL